jgi:two-component system response regulator AtoC
MTHRILVAEDEANYRQVLSLMVADLDVTLLEAPDGRAALDILAKEDVDLVITDMNMPRLDGMALLKELASRPKAPPVVVMTAYASVDSAVDAMREGAIDYLTKPFDEARLRLTLKRALRMTDLMAENHRLRDTVEQRYDFSQILGASEPMVAALKLAGKVAASDSTVLVQGESGTGKELVARAIHFNSPRRSGPFVALNCAAIPETLLEAELFGAEAGAYTGATKRRRGRVELARGGTLFLDEVGDMPGTLQTKLLRLLQEKTFTPLGAEAEQKADIRFVFATHRNLEQMVKEGKFREDLMYRVSVLRVALPPLRARGGDVALLADAFVARFAQDTGRKGLRLSAAAKVALAHHAFPGNVRELSNIIERAVILAEEEVIEPSDLGLHEPAAAAPVSASRAAEATAGETFSLPEQGIQLEEVEKGFVRQALERTAGNKSKAARLLGLTRATLRYRIEKMGLEDSGGDDG